MPLLDHFHPPVSTDHHWESFHSNWATRIADDLNDNWLPSEFRAEEHTYSGSRLEIDVATYESNAADERIEGSATFSEGDAATATLERPAVWSPTAPVTSIPAVFPESFEVRVYETTGGPTLVAAIELISPGNKDRPERRRAFAAKCAGLLQRGVSVVMIDVVTSRRANLHAELMELLEVDDAARIEGDLYAAACRPVVREDDEQIDVWTETFNVADALPTMPLRLTGDLFVPVQFEETYMEARRRRKLV